MTFFFIRLNLVMWNFHSKSKYCLERYFYCKACFIIVMFYFNFAWISAKNFKC